MTVGSWIFDSASPFIGSLVLRQIRAHASWLAGANAYCAACGMITERDQDLGRLDWVF